MPFSEQKFNLQLHLTFEKTKDEIMNFTENTHFDVMSKSRVKTDVSRKGKNASLEQLYGGDWKTTAFAKY